MLTQAISADKPLATSWHTAYYAPNTLASVRGEAGRMFFSVDPHDDVAIYEQIVRQVKFAIAEGSLQPRQLLPSARQLSGELAINPNTVARAYQILQSEGVVELLRGRGVAVCIDAVTKCRDARRILITIRLRAALAEALHGGLTAEEIRQLLATELSSLDGNVRTIASPADDSSERNNGTGT